MLPERPLGELCEFQRGLTYGKSDEVALSENVVLRANNIDLATNSLDFSELRYIAPSVQVPESKRVRTGALLICTASGSKSHLGKVAYVDADYGYAFGGFMGQLVPAEGVDGRYLFHALTSPRYKSFIDELADGLNINNLKFDDLRRFRVPLPGLEEQRRIVAILDDAFEGIATAKAHAERNLQNARELSESLVEETLTQVKARSGEQRLGDLCQIKTGKKDVNQGNPDGQYPFFTCASQHTYSDSYSFDTEALLVAGNGNVGQVSYYHGKFEAYQRTYVLMGFKNVRAGYLFRALDRRLSARVSKQKLGNTMPYIKIGMLTEFQVPVPTIEEQERITKQLNFVTDQVERLETAYQAKLTALDELKQSLLHQAFSGQL